MLNETFPSPQSNLELTLEYLGEVRFGPAYYRPHMPGFIFSEDFIVSDEVCWSQDGKRVYLVRFRDFTSAAFEVVEVDIETKKHRILFAHDGGLIRFENAVCNQNLKILLSCHGSFSRIEITVP